MSHCNSMPLEMDQTGGQPHTATLLAKAWLLAKNLVCKAVQYRLNRRRLRKLHDLDDAMLHDIGVTRSELHKVSSLPLSVDAATELQRISLARRRKEFSGELPR